MSTEPPHQTPKDSSRGALRDRLLDWLNPARRRLRDVAAEYARLQSFAQNLPMEYCGWDASGGAQAISPGFAALFGVTRIATIEDIQRELTPGDAAALETIYQRLRERGEEFEIGLYATRTRKSLKFFGKRNENFHTLWVLDVTDLAETARQSLATVTAAEERENRLRSAMDTLPFPVWTRNDALDITWCNKTYTEIVDDTAATVVAEQKNLPFSALRKGDSSPRLLAQQALAAGAAQKIRSHVIVDGQRRFYEVVEAPLRQQKGILGYAIDVTREEEWEKSYDRLNASHRESMEQLRTAIIMYDADMRVEFYNAAYEQMSGLSGAFLDARPKIGEVIDKLRELRRMPEQVDYRHYKDIWAQRFTSLLAPHEEMQYLPDGSVVRMVVVARPMGGVLITQEDVTSRMQLETSYNTLMAVQQETIDNLTEGVAVFGEDGKLRLSNKAFARMWSIVPAESGEEPHIAQLSGEIEKFFTNDTQKKIRDVVLANALEREPRRGRMVRRDGRVIDYSTVPLPDGNILNAYFDVTAAVEVEKALREKNAALETAEKLKADFLANVSYQLRTPLNALLGFAEMLDKGYAGDLNDQQGKYVGSIFESGQRLVSLINDILDLSTIEAGYMDFAPEKINLKNMLVNVVELTEDWARKQKLEMAIDMPADMAGTTIEADERRLKQVMLNLISNGINYSPHGGRLVIATRAAGEGFVDISVRDTGMGISAADLERIFTPFEKIHDGKTRRRAGAGLGLALVRRIVEAHGGRVMIESREGEGTTVTCRVPVKYTPPENGGDGVASVVH